ncbi:MAG: P27 family phage terminase small subunit, partial [Planctomycetes bacterium]|nr:P27 family phage terminase small subunit [Planctomycetota bacterium]
PTPELLENFDPPEEIASDDLAVKKWKQSVPVLRRMRVFTEADIDAWVLYCRTWANWMRAKTKCDQYGRDNVAYEIDPTRTDGRMRIKWTQPYTWAVDEKNLATDLRRLQQEFGLTPSSRSQVTIHDSPNEDPVAAYRKKRSDQPGA